MSDDAQTPEAPEVSGRSEASGGSGTSSEKGPKTSLDKPGAGAGATGPSDAVPGGPQSRTEPDPWAPPAAGAQAAPAITPGGPGHTLSSNEPPVWPAPSVHDQQTVTSMPPMGVPSEPRDAVPPAAPWTNPSAGPGPAMPPYGSTGNPFAPPTAPGPYGAHDEPVPPPPIGPDGPGQVPYGYPVGHGYPGAGPGAAGYYGWPGMQAMPSNGMGTAALVLGIISAAVFCLWPVAIILGVLALIFGSIGRGKARRGEATNPGQALAGMICGAAGVVLGLGMVALVIATA
ncbi:DUF4190 domain-containing protein [Streptomyces sp. DT2A-34]|uniref:DUF4190 domain-containing protein n=1 Tax=Streptomyces sp. DT2A-34 TaxID=3051182 RepID=UPI00265BAF75|nr:DUF4190 domain-containing protein [Streptomyces sp. DT2A-34]MDO0911401.1 DUF4190 domain-containing protein [Streptomyces sp. DT2A-34]